MAAKSLTALLAKCARDFPNNPATPPSRRFSFAPRVKARAPHDCRRPVLLPAALVAQPAADANPALAPAQVSLWGDCGRPLFLLVHLSRPGPRRAGRPHLSGTSRHGASHRRAGLARHGLAGLDCAPFPRRAVLY